MSSRVFAQKYPLAYNCNEVIELKITVKPRLGALLSQLGWSQSELSRRSGVTQSAISRFDNSERHYDWHVASIMKATGVKYEELFEVKETEEDAE
ncbi:helix-turn-helix domain-containing protein [Bacillus velezensis]|uniref:helix-turn-helix domain-containing protein n=1 Tax=Bacillus velezensis TaxID=492670 RepID=UPI003CE7B0CF